MNTFGQLLRVTTFGESHGPAIGCVIDGCPPGIAIAAEDFAHDLARRATGKTRHTSARREADEVEILSGVYEGVTTGTPVALLIRNTDARSKDYANIAAQFRPGHADYSYWQKYGIRDPRGGGRSSARETTMRVAAAVIARKWLADRQGVRVRGWLSQIGEVLPQGFDAAVIETNPFFWPHAAQVDELETYMDALRKSGDSVGARVTVTADGVPPGWGEPVYGKLSAELAAAMMSINAVKGVEIGDGFAAVASRGTAHRDEIVRDRPADRSVGGVQADLQPAPAGPHGGRRRQRGRGGHHRPPRPLRRHPRNTYLRSDAGAGADGPCPAPSRAVRRRGRGFAAHSGRHRQETIAASRAISPPRAATAPQRLQAQINFTLARRHAPRTRQEANR